MTGLEKRFGVWVKSTQGGHTAEKVRVDKRGVKEDYIFYTVYIRLGCTQMVCVALCLSLPQEPKLIIWIIRT